MSLSPWVAVDAATIPATRARELRDAWEDFVDDRLPARHWSAAAVASIPVGGGVLVLPSGIEAIAEPIEDGDVYVVRPRRALSQPVRH